MDEFHLLSFLFGFSVGVAAFVAINIVETGINAFIKTHALLAAGKPNNDLSKIKIYYLILKIFFINWYLNILRRF